MPTSRPRHQVTETEGVARAIDAAARRWPEEAGHRGLLLQRLIEAGYRALEAEADNRAAQRRTVIRATAGLLPYPPGYWEGLRDDWPA